MASDACALVEEFHDLRTQPHIELLLDQRIGHGVVMAFDFDVIVNIDPGVFPLGICIGLGWESAEGGAVKRLTQLLTGAGEFFEGMGIQGQQEGREGGIDLREGEEGVVPEAGQHPALHDLDADFHLGLIPWPSRAGGDHGEAIVLGEVRIGPIQLGFITVNSGDGRFEVIGDDDLRDATEGGKGADIGADPVRQTLGPGRLGRGVVGGPEDRHANRDLVHLPTVAVDHGDALPGVIHKELLARTVGLAHDEIKLLRPGSIGVTKPTGLQAVGRGRFIFLPQQEQGDTLPFQFVMHRPIRYHVWRRNSGRDGWKHHPFQPGLIIGGGQGPRETRRLGPADIFSDRRPTDAEAVSDLPLTQPLLPFEPQHLVDLTHG
jgi:hypothetical protein